MKDVSNSGNMMKDHIFSPTFWMYFSYVLSFIVPLFCGFTLLTVKGTIPGEQAGMHPRRLLGIIFMFSGLIFIPNMIQDIHKHITGKLGLPIFDIIINLFLIPLYFFYFRKLTKPEKLTSRRIWPHLIPGISVLITSFFLSPLQEKITGNSAFINVNLPLIIFRCTSLLLQATMIIMYTLRILHLKQEHMQKLKENYSSVENIDLRWLNQAIPLAVLFAFITLFTSCFQAIWSDYLFHISSILFIFYLFIHALNEPSICYTKQHAKLHEEDSIPSNSSPETLSTALTAETELSPVFPALPEKYLKNLGIKREKMKDELIRLFDEKEIYINGNLTITDVATLLGTNRTYVSNVINNEFGFSFYQFVNKYRIQKATILLKEGTGLTWNSDPLGASVAENGTITFTPTQYYNPVATIYAHFIGIYPKSAGTIATGKLTFTTAQVNKGQTDIMYATKVSGNKNKTDDLTIKFNHALSQLKFKFAKGNSFTSTSATVTSITIKGTKLPKEMDLSTGVITYNDTAEDIELTFNTNNTIGGATAPTEVIMIDPNSTNIKADITIQDGESTLSFPDITISVTPKQGESHEIELTFEQKTVSGQASITAWTTGSGGTGTVM